MAAAGAGAGARCRLVKIIAIAVVKSDGELDIVDAEIHR